MYYLTKPLCAFVRDTRYLAGAVLLIFILLFSCGREAVPPPAPGIGSVQRLPSTPEELRLVRRIQDVAAVLKAMYVDPMVVNEVNTAIASGYYADEKVLLADLLYPLESPLYRAMEVQAMDRKSASSLKQSGGPTLGWFAERFREEAPKVLGPERASGILSAASQAIQRSAKPERSGIDEKRHSRPGLRAAFVDDAAGISIYFPYSRGKQEWSRDRSRIAHDPADELAKKAGDAAPLVLPATVEADWVEIPDPNCAMQHIHTKAACPKIRIDDAYAMEHAVHIVGAASGAAATALSPADSVTPSSRAALSTPSVFSLADSLRPRLIYLGKVRCSRQYDRLISFTGNGGGSELKFIRGSAYITLNNDQQVTNTEFDVLPVYFTRRDIRKDREKEVFAVWDPDWNSEKTEQVFGIYEEDTRGQREFSGSLDVEWQHGDGELSVTPVSYSVMVRSQDEIIRQINWSRNSFFYYNRTGLAGCGLRKGFTWYDCRLPVAYSLPEH